MQTKTMISIVLFILIMTGQSIIALEFYDMTRMLNGEIPLYNNTGIYINHEVVEEFNKIQLNNNEQMICLLGNETEINGYYYTKTISDEVSVEGECRDVGVIGMVHTHPDGQCIQSNNDIVNMYLNKYYYDVIVCEQDKFSVYSYDSGNQPLLYFIN